MRHPSQTSPFLPTALECALLIIYPTTLVLGSVFSVLALHIARADYNPIHQSYFPPSAAPSYFAQKRNVFSVFFVKRGCFWTTIAFFLFAFTRLGCHSQP
jgi:hypothetical protein